MLKRTPLKRKPKVIKDIDIIEKDKMRSFFLDIWTQRPHVCQSCGKKLYGELKSYYMDHLLEKSIYPEFKYERANMFICCDTCHSSKSNGHPSNIHQLAINAAKAIFINNED